MSEKNLLEIKKYNFGSELLEQVRQNNFVKSCWPLVYILSDNTTRQAYVGETTDAMSRLSTHLKNSKKNSLTTAHLIMSDKFNKSAALDIESNLIKYLAGDGKFKLLNANLGIANHNYYQKKELYWDIFLTLWEELKSEGIVTASVEKINNSDLFKYSPYKSLTTEQKSGLISIIKALLDDSVSTVLVEGGAGTGKTILAIYLFAILHTDLKELDLNEFADEEESFLVLVNKLKEKFPSPLAAVVIPMAGFRSTISKVFKNVQNLTKSMVIGPAEVSKQKYDILLVDEAHRLRRRKNLGAYFGAFDKVNLKLGLNKEEGDEFRWVVQQSVKNIFFYDSGQSIKPSDVESSNFEFLRKQKNTTLVQLKSQLRSKGGNDYVSYVRRLLRNELKTSEASFVAEEYSFVLFDSLEEMVEQIKDNNQKFGLSRLVAGFAWRWISNTNETKHLHDIVIGDVRLHWNGTNIDWVNSHNAINEVGCIHTTQGYDLNYTGIIFGNEISFDKTTNKIIVRIENYFDKLGKQNIRSSEELHEYILNIYSTLMLRAIKGTYIYVCDSDLREYFKKHIATWSTQKDKTTPLEQSTKEFVASPYVGSMVSIPVYDSVGCGDFTFANPDTTDTVKVPEWLIKPGAKYFALRTRGDSMNMLGVEDGDVILCQKNYQAPNGSNAVILIGDDATLKQIKFEKDGLVLVPKSTNSEHKVRKLTEEDEEFKVLGVFVCKLEE